MLSHHVFATTLAVALAVGCAARNGEEPSPAVARGDAMTIHLDELDAFVKESLFQEETRGGAPSKVYELRSQALRSLIEQRVLEERAASQGTSVEQLLETARGEVSDADVETFYSGLERNGGRSLEQLTPDIRRHLEQRNQQDAVRSWVEEARVAILLEPPRFEVEPVGPARGPDDAVVTIIEFSDFQCPYCRRAEPVISEVLARHPERVRLVYRHLPLESIHPRARPAAEAAVCLQEQGLFWEFHDAVFADGNPLSDADLRSFAEQVGADLAGFDACLASGATAAQIDADTAAAREIGVTGTPAFLINGVLITGAQPLDAFLEVVEREIERAEASP